MQMDVMTKIALGMLSILGTVLTGVLLPYLKTKWDAGKRQKMMDFAAWAVQAAEQMYTIATGEGGAGADKKAFALRFLEEKFPRVKREDLEVLLEKAVFELNEFGKCFTE